MVELNQPAPDFSLEGDDGAVFRLSDHLGERVLVVFYPGDNTPVCTRQLCEYRDGIEVFSDLGVRLVGISPDSVESHQGFKQKHDFPFVLLSDPDLTVASAWGCKGALGMKRAVFLVDEAGIVRYAHIETLALFRRRADELVDVIRKLDEGRGSEGAG